MNTPARSALTCSLSLAALVLGTAGCAGSSEPEPEGAPPGYTHLGEFIAHVSPKSRSITFERLPSKVAGDEGPGLGPQSIDETTILQDGTPGSGPADTIELVNNGTPTTNAGCPSGFQSNTFCGNVTMRSFYAGRSLNNAYLQVTKIADTSDVDISGHNAVNSDAAFGTLSNTLGLWKFTGSGAPTGVLGPSGTGTNGGARDVIFANPDDADTKIYLHAYTTLTYSSYSRRATDGSAYVDACTGGTKVLNGSPAGATATTPLPFAFTFYGTTFASGSLITVGRKGAMGFGSQGTNAENAVNVAIPSAAGTTMKPAIFPFWDDLNYGGSGTGVCVITTGTSPFRKFSVTWKAMKFLGNTTATDNLTFSMSLNEGSDRIDIAYNTMTSAQSPTRAAGDSSTIGVQNSTGTVATGLFNSTNSTGSNKGYVFTPQP